MEVAHAGESAPRLRSAWIVAGVTVALVGLLAVLGSRKTAVYIDALDQSGLLYAVPLLLVIGLLATLEYPRLSLYLLAFVLPFNFVGGYWGREFFVLIAKTAVPVLSAAALLTTFLAPAGQRAWMTRTRLGQAALGWLAMLGVGMAIGLFSADRSFWLRESGWLLFFTAVLPFGTLLRGRHDVQRMLACTCAGAFVLQAYAFLQLVTGQRYARPDDAWESGQAFFRAPYSSQSLFVLYLAAATLLWLSSTRLLTRRVAVLLFAVIAILGGGLLASMVRSLWLSGLLGIGLVMIQAPWDRRTARAALVVAIGVGVAIGVVAAVDSLSPESTGNWTGNAAVFISDLASKDSTSKVTRELEWANAFDVWKQSPVVGMGIGYAYPSNAYFNLPDASVPDAFYLHNSYMNILAKCGAVGLAALLYLMWRTFLVLRHLARRDGPLFDRILATALVAAFIQVSVLSVTMPVLTVGDAAAYFGMLIGIAVVMQRETAREAG